MTHKFSDEEIKILVDSERKMDSGELGFVLLDGSRVIVLPDAMKHFELTQGQTINGAIMIALIEFNLASCREKIAKQATEEVLQRAQDAAAKSA